MRLLLVEDDEDLCIVTKEVLQTFGYDVEYVNTIQDALAFLQLHRDVRLVISDYYLPDGTGLDLMVSVQKTVDNGGPPFIFVSGQLDVKAEKIRQMGGKDVLIKPVGMRELSDAIKQQIGI